MTDYKRAVCSALVRCSCFLWSLPRRLKELDADLQYAPALNRAYMREFATVTAAVVVYPVLISLSCLQYQVGVSVSVLGMAKTTAAFGLVPNAGLTPFEVEVIYGVVSVLIMLDLFIGARALFRLSVIGENMLKNLKEEI